MKKKKGKVLALELVDDLFTDNKSKSKKSKANPSKTQVIDHTQKTEIVPLDTNLSSTRDDLTTKLTPEQLSRFTVGELDPPTVKATNTSASLRMHGGTISGTEAHLTHSMNLKRAQEKILDLENMIEDLRRENEKLYAASQTFRKHSDELQTRVHDLERDLVEQKSQSKEEKKILMSTLEQKDRALSEEHLEKEQLQSRLNTNLKKIRVRERELENRLEIVRLENFSLQRSKDEHLLGLKRQIDEAQIELESYRDKGKVLNLELQKKKEMLRKTVKALRLALTMLESNEKDLKVAANDD